MQNKSQHNKVRAPARACQSEQETTYKNCALPRRVDCELCSDWQIAFHCIEQTYIQVTVRGVRGERESVGCNSGERKGYVAGVADNSFFDDICSEAGRCRAIFLMRRTQIVIQHFIV